MSSVNRHSLLLSSMPPRFRRSILACAIVSVFGATVAGAPGAFAQEVAATKNFDIPAGALTESLNRFERQAGILLSFSADLTNGLHSKAVVGSYTTQAALQQLLTGSGLEAMPTSAGGFILRRMPVAVQGETLLRAVNVKARGEQESATGPVYGYLAKRTATATKTDTELRDIPQTINVVSKEFLHDRGIVKLSEVAQTVPGVQGATGYGGNENGSAFTIRGFFGSTNYRDGFRDFGFVSARDISAFERVEVLKGPASVLYGTNDPGGIVNYVTKRPQFEAERNLTLEYGSYNAKRGVLDMTGALNEIDTVAYRLIATLDDRESHRDFVNSDTQMVAPSLLFKFSDNTDLTLMAEFLWQDYLFERGLPLEPEFLDLPRERFLEEPDLNYADGKSTRLTAELKHAFNDSWLGRVAVSYLKPELEKLNFFPSGLEADRRTLLLDLDFSKEESQDTAAQFELKGQFDAMGVDHQLLSGVEFYRNRFQYTFAPFGAVSSAIDIYDPVYGQVVIPPGLLDQVGFGNKYGSRTTALYVQDQITFSEQWKATAGVRYDSSRLFNEDLLDSSLSLQEKTESRVSPRIGFVYQPQVSTALFMGYSTSFNPQVFTRKADGSLVKPETGEQVELGWREDWVGGKLTSTLSVYELYKENVSTEDPLNPLFQIQVGEQRSRGAELEIIGELMRGLNASFALSAIDAEVTKDNTIPVGDELNTYAKYSGSLWLKYQPNASGWFVGGGVFYTSERETALPNNGQTLPAEAVLDALLGYNAGKWQAQLNLRNLTDEETYLLGSYNVIPGPGFNANASVTYHF